MIDTRGASTAAALTLVVAGSLLACARQQPVATVVPGYPTPTVTRQPVTSVGTDISPAAPRPTQTRAARSRPLVPSGSVDWANTAAARAVAYCESGQDNSARSHSGSYRGKWQMDADFWRTYGGLRYAPSPELATEAEQDAVAYRGYLARGWQPWTCARIVGVR